MMDYQQLLTQRRSHPAWRLLAADHAPMIASFLHRSFIAPNTRTIARQQLVSQLDDHLFQLHEASGENLFPKAAASYLDDWASDERGWLRKYYPQGQDEPHYDLTSPAELALEWLHNLGQRHFIGTESRLMTVFGLLKQIVDGTELNPRTRIAELQKRKADIDADIARIREGHLELMEPTQVRERFLHMASTARELLSDFRALDQNFRALDRGAREQIATWEGSKGELLEQIFSKRDLIADSDEGRSFRAFWDLLMSPSRQDELGKLLERVMALDPIRELEPDGRLRRIHYDWLEAGEVTQRTVARLSEQLRRYLDDQAWLENRRIMELIRNVEQKALQLRGQVPEQGFGAIDAAGPDVGLPMERVLYAPPFKAEIRAAALDEPDVTIAADALFDQVYVDQVRLMSNVRRALQTRRQVSLAAVVMDNPIEQGLAELATYLKLATQDVAAVIDEERNERIDWIGTDGKRREATLPMVIFTLREQGGT
jgi:flagellar motility protein MotE (MotC chaperone)